MLLFLGLRIGELVKVMAVYDNGFSYLAALRASSQLAVILSPTHSLPPLSVQVQRADLHVFHFEIQHQQSSCRL